MAHFSAGKMETQVTYPEKAAQATVALVAPTKPVSFPSDNYSSACLYPSDKSQNKTSKLNIKTQHYL